MKKIFFTLLTISSLFLYGCKNNENIEGTWEVEKVVTGGTVLLDKNSYLEFSSENGKWNISGNSGVNTFHGEIEINDGNIKIRDLAMTKMMGDPSAQEYEDIFIEVLMSVKSYTYSESKKKLVLKTGNEGEEIQLSRSK